MNIQPSKVAVYGSKCGDCEREFNDAANSLSIFDYSVCLGCRAMKCDECGQLFTDDKNVDCIANTERCKSCHALVEMAKAF